MTFTVVQAEGEEMGSTRKNAQVRTLWALTLTLVLALLAAVLLAATAPASAAETGRTLAKPGKPTAKTPKGAIATTKPTFTWSKAARATRYELRVYQGAKLVLKKTGIKKRSWTSAKALPQGATLSWKVRGKNARGSGPWSRSLKFKVATPPPPPPPPSSAKAITAFSLAVPAATGVIAEATHTIALTVPFGTNVTALAPTIAISGASVSPASGVAQDFTAPRTYTVTAADGTTQAYAVTVTVAPNPAKAITKFEFSGFYPVVAGHIDETGHTIAVTVPHGSSLEHVQVTFTTTGASVAVGGVPQQSGLNLNDFTNPVTYTVTAADGTTQDYVVTVTVAPKPPKTITAFSFQGLAPPVTGVVTEATHTIALAVPFGTDVTALVATFATTGASVAVGATPQVSGTTPNDFTIPVTYTVIASDGDTQTYLVTVTITPLAIGDAYQGGIVAYILQSGDPGYVPGQTHGLIAATMNQRTGQRWWNGAFSTTGATGTALGTGLANTNAIIAAQGAIAISYAAGSARGYDGGGYTDWYLPSKDELHKLYLSRELIGNFGTRPYWSSSEYDATYAWRQDFPLGGQDYYYKWSDTSAVRAVRSF